MRKANAHEAEFLAALAVLMMFLVGCGSFYEEPSTHHTYVTSTQEPYPGTGLDVRLKGPGPNLDYWFTVYIDGRKILATNAEFGKRTFQALPPGQHRLRVEVASTAWAIPTPYGSAVFNCSLKPGQRGLLVVNMLFVSHIKDRSNTDLWHWENVSMERIN